ncbi:MAG: hypothetical protein DMD49_11760 [Gemmatimonadetes bacterium]|nr:MAG: hypothetical protein DMD49_11760 [Gemmatimonadota bacterium]
MEGFVGPNGAGKSTTMRMITQYIEPDAGRRGGNFGPHAHQPRHRSRICRSCRYRLRQLDHGRRAM